MLVVANFKMNGNKNFFLKLNETYEKLKIKGTNEVLCPPFVYLSNLNIKNKNVCLGAQDISIVGNNKSTGQIGAYMLKEFNVKYCIIGHSERRAIGETGEMIAKKVKSACENKIIPIICVGEATKQDKSSAVKNQVKSALKYLQPGSKIIFAYEPVWAIGSGQVPTIKHINNKIKTIKAEQTRWALALKFCTAAALTITIFYN